MVKPLGRLIVGLVVVILVVIVAFQNRRPVHIRVLWWTLPHVALALVVLVAILIGVLLGMAAIGWAMLQRHRTKPSDHLNAVPDEASRVVSGHSTTHSEPSPEKPADASSPSLTHDQEGENSQD